MNLDFLLNLPDLPKWRILKNELISKEKTTVWKEEKSLGSYTLVHALVDQNQELVTWKLNQHDVDSFIAFTDPQKFHRLENIYGMDFQLQEEGVNKDKLSNFSLKIMMVGELTKKLNQKGLDTSIKINPCPVVLGNGAPSLIFSEEVLFAPQYDEFTGKNLLTDADEAKALLAINPDDEQRFGIEMVYYMLTNTGIPEEGEEREKGLKDKIEELAFKAPRIPLKRGSGSFLSVLLNFENDIEERAFIRDYSTFDNYSDLVFVTSTLKMWTGKLEEIHFNGEKIDTIFAPLIKWQQGKMKHVPYFNE